jgi:ferredoxin
MGRAGGAIGAMQVIDRSGLDALIRVLGNQGYTVVGPVVRDGAIVYDTVTGIDDLPVGWTDEQEAGTYRVRRRGDDAVFGFVVGPHSWKRYLFPARQRLFRARQTDQGMEVEAEPSPAERYAFLGVRSCELAAMGIQDRVFGGGPYTDSAYAERRRNSLVIAVNCAEAHGTCFCASMGTGPRARDGYDLALTEIRLGERHGFTVEVGSEAGETVLRELDAREADTAEQRESEAVSQRTEAQMGRHLDTTELPRRLMENLEHPRWDDVADRCLGCANCTMVCPTCFCSTVEDVSDLTGTEAERVRHWDSCFNQAFSYVAGGSVRTSTRARYRQWLTHKLATWHDQFGSSGCVGCGRCITWCPVGIDITEEARVIASDDGESN